MALVEQDSFFNHQDTSASKISLTPNLERVKYYPWPGVTEQVKAEVENLSSYGVDVALVDEDLEGHYRLTDERQERTTAAIEEWSKKPGFVDEFFGNGLHPAGAAWHGVAKRAIALHAFYNVGSISSPSEGIDRDILDRKLFNDGQSAREIIQAEYDAEQADALIGQYEAFFDAGNMEDNEDIYGLTTHDYIAGSVDRIADVTRAKTAIRMIMEHIDQFPGKFKNRGLVSASLACGAAEPVFWLANTLRDRGDKVQTIHLVDNDPVALAASTSRAEHHKLSSSVKLHRENLLKTPVDGYIEPKSVDLVDLIGLFEYLPRQIGKYNLAGNLLADVAKIVRPGGIIVFGNMLNSRPQQAWFDGLWPKLHQRSVSEVLDIIEEAGFSREQVKVRIPANEGVYALYAIQIPEVGFTAPEVSEQQRKLGSRVLKFIPNY